MTWTLALTGGIASGKTTVANLFAAHGIEIIDADIAARAVVAPQSPAHTDIVGLFGSAVLLENGELNRRQLRDIIFAEPHKRQQLEAITHPAIRAYMLDKRAKCQSAYAIMVIPLLVEHLRNWREYIDRILLIDCESALQMTRLQARDQHSPAQAELIINAQCSRQARQQVADDILNNSNAHLDLAAEVCKLHQQYLKLARQAQTIAPKS